MVFWVSDLQDWVSSGSGVAKDLWSNPRIKKYFKCIFHPDPDCGRENVLERWETTRQCAPNAAFRMIKFHLEEDELNNK